jgi:hypothetical protein
LILDILVSDILILDILPWRQNSGFAFRSRSRLDLESYEAMNDRRYLYAYDTSDGPHHSQQVDPDLQTNRKRKCSSNRHRAELKTILEMLFSNDTDHGMSTSRGRFLKNLS